MASLQCRRFTYAELAHLTNQAANGLKALNVQPGQRLILHLPNGPAFPLFFIGAIKLGVVPVPVSFLLTKSELQFIISDSRADWLVTVEKNKTCLMRVGKDGVESKAQFQEDEIFEWFSSYSEEFKTEPSDSSSPAYWLYTSGTEGKPKGVVHSQGSISAHDERVHLWQDLKKGDVAFNTSSLNWSYALTAGLLDILRYGGTSVITSVALNPEKISQVIQQCGVTLLMSVPGIYRRLTEYLEISHDFSSFKKLRVCLSAGERLSQGIRERFHKLTGLTIREGLGMTEHSVYLVQQKERPVIPGSCGQALPGHPVTIIKEDGSEAHVGEVGILASHSSCPGLMLGYHHSAEESSSQKVASEFLPLQGDWFCSGDLAARDSEGNFFYKGRRDDLITAGGYRISPLEVEDVLNQIHEILESSVGGREIEPGKTIVIAFVVLKDKAKQGISLEKNILDFASENLARYKVPRKIIFVDSLLKSVHGKIKRKHFDQTGLSEAVG